MCVDAHITGSAFSFKMQMFVFISTWAPEEQLAYKLMALGNMYLFIK
jgi:hypothetical protein